MGNPAVIVLLAVIVFLLCLPIKERQRALGTWIAIAAVAWAIYYVVPLLIFVAFELVHALYPALAFVGHYVDLVIPYVVVGVALLIDFFCAWAFVGDWGKSLGNKCGAVLMCASTIPASICFVLLCADSRDAGRFGLLAVLLFCLGFGLIPQPGVEQKPLTTKNALRIVLCIIALVTSFVAILGASLYVNSSDKQGLGFLMSLMLLSAVSWIGWLRTNPSFKPTSGLRFIVAVLSLGFATVSVAFYMGDFKLVALALFSSSVLGAAIWHRCGRLIAIQTEESMVSNTSRGMSLSN